MLSQLFLTLALSSRLVSSAATVQGTCTQHDTALASLANQLSSSAVIACANSTLQQYNVNRYWGTQFGKNASVVVFPTTAQEVSYAVQATCQTPLGKDFAFVGGAHGIACVSRIVTHSRV